MTLTNDAGAIDVAETDPDYNATLVRRVDLTDDLSHFWVLPDVGPGSFEPGQYVTIGLRIAGKLVQRPYSVASRAEDFLSSGYELYLRRNPDGAFTPALWTLPIGHRIRVTGPRGRLVTDPTDDRVHLLVSSGTANAPFVAMIRHWQQARRQPRAVLVNGVSYTRELAFREELERWDACAAGSSYVPTVSRVHAVENAGWRGTWGRAESRIDALSDELKLEPGNTTVFLCGNPAMVDAATGILVARGFAPDQLKTELYWPKRPQP